MRLEFGGDWIEIEGKDGSAEMHSSFGRSGATYADGVADGIESLVLALFCAGVDLEDSNVHEAIQTAIDALGNLI